MVANKYEQHGQKFLKLQEAFEDMWDGHLGRTTTAKHRIGLADNDVRSVQRSTYRVSLKARQFAATKTDRMLREQIIEPATTKWQAQSYSSQRRTAHSDSASTAVISMN